MLQSYYVDAVQDPPANTATGPAADRNTRSSQSVLVRNVNTKLVDEKFVAFTIISQLSDEEEKVAAITKAVFSLLREMAAT
jgi:hypothetical protein